MPVSSFSNTENSSLRRKGRRRRTKSNNLIFFTLHSMLYFIQKDPLEIQNSTSHLNTFHTAQSVLTFVLM